MYLDSFLTIWQAKLNQAAIWSAHTKRLRKRVISSCFWAKPIPQWTADSTSGHVDVILKRSATDTSQFNFKRTSRPNTTSWPVVGERWRHSWWVVMLAPLHSTEEAAQGPKGRLAQVLLGGAPWLRKASDAAALCCPKAAAETTGWRRARIYWNVVMMRHYCSLSVYLVSFVKAVLPGETLGAWNPLWLNSTAPPRACKWEHVFKTLLLWFGLLDLPS